MADISAGNITASLKIDSTEWQRGLQQAAQQLGTLQRGLTGGLSPALQQVQQSITTVNATTAAFVQQTQRATSATSAWSQAMQIASGVGLATSISGLVSSLASFARETVNVGARMEQLRASLSALAGSALVGQSQFDSLFQTAQRLGVPLEGLARGWRTLTAAASQAGLPIADQRRLLEAVATEGRRVGASNEELSRAFLALGQMASKGVVSLEELRQQLSEAIPTSLSAMATGMGRTTDELLKLVEAGGVRFPTAARALVRGLEEMQRQGGATTETLQTGFNRFGNELIRTRDELTRTMGPLSQLTHLASNFLKVINDSAQAQRQLREARQEEARIGTGGLRAADIARLPAAQRARAEALPGLIAEQEEAQRDPSFLARFGPNRADTIAQLKAEQQSLFQAAEALKAKNAEEVKATAAAKQATAAADLQRDTMADLTKQMDALTTAQTAFRQKAALAPETFGRPGTVEFLRGQEQALRPGVEKLAQSLATLPQGVTLEAPVAARAKTFDVEVGTIGRRIDAIKDSEQAASKAAREAEAERKRLAREAEAELEQGARQRVQQLRDIIQTEERQFQQLQNIHQRYTTIKEVADAGEASELAAALATSTHADQAARLAAEVRGVATVEAQLVDLRRQAEASAPAGERAIAAAKDEADALKVLADHLERVRGQRDALTGGPAGEDIRIAQRTREKILSPEGLEQAGQMQRETARVRMETERVTQALEVWHDLSYGVGSAWTSALSSIADHTKSVGEAFAEMGRSILKTMADIAASQATQALFKLGFGLITKALMPTVAPAAAGGSYGGVSQGFSTAALPYGYGEFQHGGVITQPTLSLLGEGYQREHVVPGREFDQMQAAMRSGPTDVHTHVIVVANQQQAEQEKAAAAAQGHEAVIVNAVMNDIARGSNSKVYRGLRQLGT
jgi:tape measure domain-containing protein